MRLVPTNAEKMIEYAAAKSHEHFAEGSSWESCEDDAETLESKDSVTKCWNCEQMFRNFKQVKKVQQTVAKSTKAAFRICGIGDA